MPAVLLERQHEIDALLEAVTTARDGRGRAVLVTGEAGIGKTSVVRQFLRHVDPDVRVLQGACDDLLAPRALGPVRDAVRGANRRLESALQEVSAGSAMRALVAELSAGPPTVLVIEDIHWADDATLDVLHYLARRIDGLPSVLALTCREEVALAGRPIQQLLGALVGPSTVRLRLAPLSSDAVVQLSQAVGRHGSVVYALTGGNPFYVSEALAAPPDAMPASVADAVRARLQRLGADCRSAVEQLSVVPTAVEFPLAEALLGDRLDVLVEAEARGIIEVRDTGLAFRHELARRVVEGGLPRLRRRSLNQAVVRALGGAEHPDLERLVHHAVQADDVAAIVRFAPRAAREAVAAGSHRQALAHFAAAVPNADQLSPAEHARLLDGYAWELYNAHRFTQAVAVSWDVVARFERLGDQVALGEALVRLSRHIVMSGDTDEAERVIERAVRVLGSAGSATALAIATTDQGAMLTLTGQPAEAVAVLRNAQRLAEQAGRPDLVSLCLNYLALARSDLGEPDAVADLRRALAIAVDDGCHEAAARAYVNLSELLHCSGKWAELAEIVDAGLSFAAEHGLWQHTYILELQRQVLHLYHGDWDAAEQGLRALVERSAEPSKLDVYAIAVYGRLLARLGRPEAESLLEQAWQRANEQRSPLGLARTGIALVEWAWLTGRPDRARAIRDALLSRMRSPGWAFLCGELLRYLARAGLTAEPFEGCPEGYAAGLRGDWQLAAASWERAAFPYERALELTESGQAGPTVEGLRMLEELGAAAPAALVRVRLRELGVTRAPRGPRTSTRANPAGLTDRQLDVLQLLEEGATNAEIAARLVLSVRTVDHHVAAILAKFGAQSRREAVAAARSLEPVE